MDIDVGGLVLVAITRNDDPVGFYWSWLYDWGGTMLYSPHYEIVGMDEGYRMESPSDNMNEMQGGFRNWFGMRYSQSLWGSWSYKQIAQAIGPLSYRAVANACASNPYAPEVPCHRVICEDGSIGGYSADGGIARKIELLETESLIRLEVNYEDCK